MQRGQMPVASKDHSTFTVELPEAISESRRRGHRPAVRVSEVVADPDLDVFVEGLAEAPEIAEARHMAESLGFSVHGNERPGSRAGVAGSAASGQRPSHPSDNEIAELWHETTRLQRQFAAAEMHRAAVGRHVESAVAAFASMPAVAIDPGERNGHRQRPSTNGPRAGARVTLAAAVSLSIIAAASLGVFDPIRGWLHQRLGWTAAAVSAAPVADAGDAATSGSTPASDSDQTR
jgi:hypothetical protein